MVFKIAWRNLWRRTRRTLLTVTTVSLGLALLLISLGLGDGSHIQMIDSAVRMGSAHLLIQQKGYQEGAEIGLTLSPREVRSVKQWIDDQKSLFPIQQQLGRVFASGLASSADGATGVQILGVEPRAEQEVSLFHERLVEGRFLGEGDTDTIVVGEGIARKLRLGIDSKMVLMAQAVATTEIQSKLVRVGGVMRTGLEQLDRMLVLMPLDSSREFLELGEGLHQVAVFLGDDDYSQELAALGKSAFPELEVLDWGEALPELRDFIRVDDGGNYVFNVFIFLLIAFTVMNTMLMSVLERSREFALLDALGLTPAKRFAMVFVEAGFIGLLSITFGFILGYSAHLYLYVYGLPLDLFSSEGFSAAGVVLDPIMYSDLSLNRIAGSFLSVLTLTLVLTLVPAFRAARGGNIYLLGSK